VRVAAALQTVIRQEPASRLRQQLWGLLLLVVWLPMRALAAPPDLAAAATQADRDSPLAGLSPQAAKPVAPSGSVTSALKQRAMTILPRQILPVPQVLRDGFYALREKFSSRISEPDPGAVYLDTFNKPDVLVSDRLSQLSQDDIDLLESHDRAWQHNGLQDLSKPDRNGLREVRFVPQILMNLNQIVDVPGRMQLGVTYRSWDCPDAGAFADVRPVPQMSFRWTYD
jgi:hypothetical protein